MAQARATTEEARARVNAIYDMLLTGLTVTQLTRHCCDLWGIGEDQVHKYVRQAREHQLTDAQIERPQWLMQALSKLQNYERLAAEKGNIATSLRCVEMQARLLRFELN